jgi:RimJ/RimL family protein N-acetyltransferase
MRLRLDDYDALQEKLGVTLTEPHYGDAAYDKRVQASLQSVTEHLERSASGYLWYTFWQIVSREHNCIVGEFDFHGPPDENGEVGFGYVVRLAYRRRGYATEAVGAMASWAFKQRGVTALVADTESDNIASRRVLEKSGARMLRVEKDVLRWKIAAP